MMLLLLLLLLLFTAGIIYTSHIEYKYMIELLNV